MSSYDLRRGGFTLVSPSVPTTETSACWIAITPDGRFAYSGNAASMSITGYAIGRHGELTILTADGKTASGTPASPTWRSAPTAATSTPAWATAPSAPGRSSHDGTLAPVGSFPGLPAGAAGIAAT